MKNNCSNCKFCSFIGDQTSPGGMMLIANYQCDNTLSTLYGHKMNIISSHMGTLDSREKNNCVKHEFGPNITVKKDFVTDNKNVNFKLKPLSELDIFAIVIIAATLITLIAFCI